MKTALTSPDDRTAGVPTATTKAKVTRDALAEKYAALLIVDRPSFKLTLLRSG